MSSGQATIAPDLLILLRVSFEHPDKEDGYEYDWP